MIRDADIKLFVKHAKALNRVIKQIQQYHPEVSLYNTPRLLHLMSGETHSAGATAVPQHNNVVASVAIDTLTGGDW